jgi:hypothetical protein
MKKIPIFIIIAAFVLSIPALAELTNTVTAVQAPPEDAAVGLWGGKWDDTWPVFLLVETNAGPNTYKVQYHWLENFNDPKFSTKELTGYKTNNYVHAKFLDFRMTGTKGMLYGEFETPRMANLVKLYPTDNPTAENADDLLEKYGWVGNSIPASKALEKITGP